MKPHPLCFFGGCSARLGKGLEPPPSSNPRLPSCPELKNNGLGRRKKGRREKHGAPAAPAPRSSALAALALAGSGGAGRRSPVWCYRADLEIFWGGMEGGRGGWKEGGGHGHRRLRRERAQGWFCDAGFLLASGTRRQLLAGSGCSWGHRDRGDKGGIGARLNVPVVLAGREQEALASPWNLPSMGKGARDVCPPRGGRERKWRGEKKF